MKKTLIILAHPSIDKSMFNKPIAENLKKSYDFFDLYAQYSTKKINIQQERDRILQYDNIILQFPIYWYQAPSLLKEYIDTIFDFEFVTNGYPLENKNLMVVTTLASSMEDTDLHNPNNRVSPILKKMNVDNLMELILSPYTQLAHIVKMNYIKPAVLYGVYTTKEEQITTEITNVVKYVNSVFNE